MITYLTRAFAVVALLALLVPQAATAAVEISITSPEHGATISRSTTPTMQLAGTVAFEEPVVSSRTLYLRREECSTTAGFLSDVTGPNEGNSCEGFPAFLLTPLPGENDYSHRFDSSLMGEVQGPITLDASRNITGEINIRANTNTPNWHIFDVEVQVGTTTLPRQRFDDGGPQATSFRTLELDIDIPESLDKVDVNQVAVTVYYQQSVLSWVELNTPTSQIHLPTYSDSFNRQVLLKIDSATPFAANLSEDGSAWSASRTTPAVGNHTITAIARQGGTERASVTHGFTVTE